MVMKTYSMGSLIMLLSQIHRIIWFLISPINVILELSIEKRDMQYAIFGA